MWRSSILVNLQACRLRAGNFTNWWTPSHVFFNTIWSPLPCSPNILAQAFAYQILKSPPHIFNTGGKPYPVSILSVVSKVFEKPVNHRIVDHLRNAAFLLISSMVLDLVNQMQIIWQLYLIILLGLLTGLGLLKL